MNFILDKIDNLEVSPTGYETEKLIEIAVENLNKSGNCSIVDVGSGTGKISFELIKYGFQIIATEPNNIARYNLNRKITDLGYNEKIKVVGGFFMNECFEKYDCIIFNPPRFFTESNIKNKFIGLVKRTPVLKQISIYFLNSVVSKNRVFNLLKFISQALTKLKDKGFILIHMTNIEYNYIFNNLNLKSIKISISKNESIVKISI